MDNAIGDGDVPTHSDGDLNIKSCVLMKSYICENKPLTHKMKSDFRLVYSPAYEFTWFKEECFAKGEKKKKRNELAGGMSWEKYLSGVILIVQLWKKDIKIQPFLTVTFL